MIKTLMKSIKGYGVPSLLSIVFVSFLIGWIINKMYLKLLKLLSL